MSPTACVLKDHATRRRSRKSTILKTLKALRQRMLIPPITPMLKTAKDLQSLRLCLYILKTQNSTLRKAYDNGTSTEPAHSGVQGKISGVILKIYFMHTKQIRQMKQTHTKERTSLISQRLVLVEKAKSEK